MASGMEPNMGGFAKIQLVVASARSFANEQGPKEIQEHCRAQKGHCRRRGCRHWVHFVAANWTVVELWMCLERME